MPLFRILSTLTVMFVIARELFVHLPAWAIASLGYVWLAILVFAGYDALRENRRDRAARNEYRRYGNGVRSAFVTAAGEPSAR